MAITKDTVKYVAHLARIDLSLKESEKLARELEGILDFIDKLIKIPVGIKPVKMEMNMFSVSEKASEMIREFLKDRAETPSIRVVMQEGG